MIILAAMVAWVVIFGGLFAFLLVARRKQRVAWEIKLRAIIFKRKYVALKSLLREEK